MWLWLKASANRAECKCVCEGRRPPHTSPGSPATQPPRWSAPSHKQNCREDREGSREKGRQKTEDEKKVKQLKQMSKVGKTRWSVKAHTEWKLETVGRATKKDTRKLFIKGHEVHTCLTSVDFSGNRVQVWNSWGACQVWIWSRKQDFFTSGAPFRHALCYTNTTPLYMSLSCLKKHPGQFSKSHQQSNSVGPVTFPWHSTKLN